MRFLYFIEKDNRIGFTTNGLGKLSAFFITDVSGRRTDKTCYTELILILTHIDTCHHVLIVKQVLCQRLGQLGFADTRRSQKDKRTDRSTRIAQSGTATPYSICNGLYGLVLSYYTLV